LYHWFSVNWVGHAACIRVMTNFHKRFIQFILDERIILKWVYFLLILIFIYNNNNNNNNNCMTRS